MTPLLSYMDDAGVVHAVEQIRTPVMGGVAFRPVRACDRGMVALEKLKTSTTPLTCFLCIVEGSGFVTCVDEDGLVHCVSNWVFREAGKLPNPVIVMTACAVFIPSHVANKALNVSCPICRLQVGLARTI